MDAQPEPIEEERLAEYERVALEAQRTQWNRDLYLCANAVPKLVAEVRRLRERDVIVRRVLDNLEWSVDSDDGYWRCPSCGAIEGRGGHKPECELHKLLHTEGEG